MNIVVLEAECLGTDVTMKGFEQFGQVTYYSVTAYEEIKDRLKEADIAIINRCRMEEATLSQCENLKLICIMGTGMDMVDHDYVASRNIIVRNVKEYSTDSVAQHTFAMLFYLLEHMRYYDEFVKEKNYIWEVKQDYTAHRFTQIAGKTWGICGLGAIGRQVARIAKAFGCNVIYYSTSGNNPSQEFKQVEFTTLLEQSDILSVHAPLTKMSRELFGYEEFCKMKQTAIFLNLGRGAIIKEEDLARALLENKILAAGLDVLIKEPMTLDSPFLPIKDSSKLLITPHIAWSSREARQTVINEICNNIKNTFPGE